MIKKKEVRYSEWIKFIRSEYSKISGDKEMKKNKSKKRSNQKRKEIAVASFTLFIICILLGSLSLIYFLNIPAGSDINGVYGSVYDGPYESWGIGGGGAMSSFSMSPYDTNLWFVGTDMGTLFRSIDAGGHWSPISQTEVVFSADLPRACYVGFSPRANIVFFARSHAWSTTEYRSTDYGVTWDEISLPLNDTEYIRYWFADSTQEELMFAASSEGLFKSVDFGETWARIGAVTGYSTGSFIDYTTNRVFHSTRDEILVSNDGGETFSTHYSATTNIQAFTGGRDSSGLTLAFLDNWPYAELASVDRRLPEDLPQVYIDSGRVDCIGYVWQSHDDSAFEMTTRVGGDHLCMAENDAQTIYVTGLRFWALTDSGSVTGTGVWLSRDAAATWDLSFMMLEEWDLWDSLEKSAVGLDIGYWDGGYESFSVNKRNSAIAGGSEYFFLHVSKNYGQDWLSPFTEYADDGPREKGKRWKSNGLEVTSTTRIEVHPTDENIIYAGFNDIHGMVSEDGGDTWRLLTGFLCNVIYDFAFDPDDTNVVYAASGYMHDWPIWWHALHLVSSGEEVPGGIFKSTDRGRTWARLTPDTGEMYFQYLSVAYNHITNTLYAGTQGKGIVRSLDDGASWEWYNTGIYSSEEMIIGQIEIDFENNNVYALLSGDYPEFENQNYTGLYMLDVYGGATSWKILRGTVHVPSEQSCANMWYYPSCFAVDFSSNLLSNNQRATIWLGDYENAGGMGQWLSTGIWKTTNGGDTWTRLYQYSFPTCIKIDPSNSNRVYFAGGYSVSGGWGYGGPLYTNDGGPTLLMNEGLPFEGVSHSIAFFLTKPDYMIYGFHGGGMRYGPKPT